MPTDRQRSQQARRLARRLAQRQQVPRPEGLRWTALLSWTAHLGVGVLLLALIPPCRAPVPPTPPAAPLELVHLELLPLEPAPADRPVDELPPDPVDETRYVRVDVAEEPPEHADRIAARDARADRDRRAPRDADAPGLARARGTAVGPRTGPSPDAGTAHGQPVEGAPGRDRSGPEPREHGVDHGERLLLTDPVAELREALGFGPIDRAALAPRPDWADDLARGGAAGGTPHVDRTLDLDWTTDINARGTPLGQWLERAETAIARSWASQDLDTLDRAMGIQGAVTVQYRVSRSGRVEEVAVVRSSGNPRLDAMARRAVPERLPRPPREAGPELFHKITLRYRNPVVRSAG